MPTRLAATWPAYDKALSAAERKTRFAAFLLGLTDVKRVALFLLGWQLATKVLDIKPYELPTPSSVLSHMNSDKTFYLENARTTLWEAFLGFIIAFGIAMVLALYFRSGSQVVLPQRIYPIAHEAMGANAISTTGDGERDI